MGRDADKPDVSHEIPGVVGVGRGHLTGRHQTMAVLHEAVTQITELGPGAVRHVEKPSQAITAGAVGLMGEQQTSEIAFGSHIPPDGRQANALSAKSGRWIIVDSIDPLH